MSKFDGSITVAVNADDSKAVAELNKVEQKIKKLETEYNKLSAERDAATQSARQQEIILDREMALLQEMRNAPKGTYEKAEIAEQAERVRALRAEYNSTERSVERMTAQMGKTSGKIDEAKTRAGELTERITSSSSAMSRMKNATAEADKKMEKFADRVKNLAKRVFVFSLITSALRSMRTWFGNVIKSNKEATAAIAKLKGALLTLVQPLVNVIVPALTTFVNLLTNVVNAAARVLSGIFGTTAEGSAKSAEALYNQTKALDSTGAAAKKASKSLANFDEINSLDDNSDSSSGSSDSSIAPDFSGVVSGGLSSVAELFVGIALVALGAVLTFSGASIPVGLAMMVAGGMLVYESITSDPTVAQKLVSSGLDLVILVVGAALLAIGAILTFSGASIPLGIALMAMGALSLAAAVTLNWGAISSFISENITEILLLVSGALLAIGAVLALTGVNLPLGIALMAAGAATLMAAAIINMDAINEALQGPIGAIVALVSGALLVLGAILTFTGANIPLGIGLLLAGVVGLSKVATVNWDSIIEALRGPIGGIAAIVGAALLVLGVILLFTGAGIPLGLGLMAAGAVGLAAAIAPNWDFILEKIRGAWRAIKEFWSENIAPIFTAEWWGNLAKKAINGFLSVLESGINLALKGAAALVNGIIGLINKIPGIDIAPVDWGHVQLPRLAQGAVIPPNREFLAVLGDQKSGTNIEAPLETIVQAFRQALSEQGGGGRSQTVILQLDRRELGRAVLDVGTQESTRIGTKLVY